MELPKHTCVSCGYFGEKADASVDTGRRGLILNDKLSNAARFSFNYSTSVCSKLGKPCLAQKGTNSQEIRAAIITTNQCKNWLPAVDGMSPIATEQRELSKGANKSAKAAFWVIVITLLVAIATLIATCVR